MTWVTLVGLERNVSAIGTTPLVKEKMAHLNDGQGLWKEVPQLLR